MLLFYNLHKITRKSPKSTIQKSKSFKCQKKIHESKNIYENKLHFLEMLYKKDKFFPLTGKK